MNQCNGITKKELRCKRLVKVGYYCSDHIRLYISLSNDIVQHLIDLRKVVEYEYESYNPIINFEIHVLRFYWRESLEYEKLRHFIQSKFISEQEKFGQLYPSQMNIETENNLCPVCDEEGKIMRCSNKDCSYLCCNCLIDYLSSDPILLPVLEQEVAGVYCPFSRNHTLVLSFLFMALSSECEDLENLKLLQIKLSVKYAKDRASSLTLNTKEEVLKQFIEDGRIGTLVRVIEDEILRDVCPNCQKPYISDGCEAIACICGWNFCNVCLEFKTRGDAHEHIRYCIRTNIPDYKDIHYPGSNERTVWRYKQRCRRIRDFLIEREIPENESELILASIYDKHHDLRKYLNDEFKDLKLENKNQRNDINDKIKKRGLFHRFLHAIRLK